MSGKFRKRPKAVIKVVTISARCRVAPKVFIADVAGLLFRRDGLWRVKLQLEIVHPTAVQMAVNPSVSLVC